MDLNDLSWGAREESGISSLSPIFPLSLVGTCDNESSSGDIIELSKSLEIIPHFPTQPLPLIPIPIRTISRPKAKRKNVQIPRKDDNDHKQGVKKQLDQYDKKIQQITDKKEIQKLKDAKKSKLQREKKKIRDKEMSEENKKLKLESQELKDVIKNLKSIIENQQKKIENLESPISPVTQVQRAVEDEILTFVQGGLPGWEDLAFDTNDSNDTELRYFMEEDELGLII